MKTCTKCKQNLSKSLFNKKKTNKDGYAYTCKSCCAAYMKEYCKTDKNKEYSKQYFQNRSDEQKEKRNKYFKEWVVKNKEKLIQYDKERYQNNKHVYIQRSALRKANKLNATPKWANIEQIKLFYKEAKQLSIETGIMHHVDHIVPLKNKNVCGLHVEHNLQILTAKENLAKSNKYQ